MSDKDLLGNYKLVLGLEVHIQAKTQRKMFCGCKADIWNTEPNTKTCPVCLGLPGALPVPNKEAVEKAHLLGLVLNSKISEKSWFDRKHYFYPDLPKGYQISQYNKPLCIGGSLKLDSGEEIQLDRIHLEEDAAKSFHKGNKTLIDFNKSGIPLIELVTKPVFTSVGSAVEFSRKVHLLVKFLGLSDADMEKGQMRLEPNISLRTNEMEEKDELPKYKVEVKNINSFRFMEKVIKYEIKRQRELLEKGETPAQENRGFDESSGKTLSQRGKEEAHDYRYFPEPDIPPMFFDNEYITQIKKKIPKLPDQLIKELVKKYGIPEESVKAIIRMDKTDQLRELVEEGLKAKEVANLLINKKEYQNISTKEFISKTKSQKETVSDESELGEFVRKVIEANKKAKEDYKKGKESALKFLIGQVMRETKGKADPKVVEKLLLEKLKN